MTLFDSPADMEPLLPDDRGGKLAETAIGLLVQATRLTKSLRQNTRSEVAALVRSMNGYYSNLIEGHRTKPHDIEAALRKDFSAEKEIRDKQLLHVAHLEAQESLETLNPSPRDLVQVETICRIHKEFCQRLPPEMLVVADSTGTRYEVVPGQLRQFDVAVGRHVAPDYKALPKMLGRYAQFYSEASVQSTPLAIIAATAAHHRLAWLHPFGDGNGRVARLLTHLWLRAIGCGGDGLWSLSRGLARRVADYRAVLDAADAKRGNDFDGRGYLSESALGKFCAFVLDTAVDQVQFMDGLLGITGFEKKLSGYCRQQEAEGNLPRGASLLVKQVFLEDEIKRGDAARILNISQRSAQTIIGKLLEKDYLRSPSPKGVLMLAFPEAARPFLFPDLYPVGTSAD